MKNWIPIPGSKKDIIIQLALNAFNEKGYEEVNIKDLAKEAGMTTGVIYHHFGSKATLYTVIRNDIEQRIIDRMEGAVELFKGDLEKVEAALTTGFNSSIKLAVCRLLCEENQHGNDKIEEYIKSLCDGLLPGLPFILMPAFRSVLQAYLQEKLTVEEGKELLTWLCKKEL